MKTAIIVLSGVVTTLIIVGFDYKKRMDIVLAQNVILEKANKEWLFLIQEDFCKTITIKKHDY